MDAPEFTAFLQRAVGYSLTGDTREEVLFMPLGPGATGKSTFLESIKAVMGDYATTTDFETFIQKRNDGGPRNDIAALAGRRMVVSIEVQEGKKLAENIVKNITGGDTVSARFLYQEKFEFRLEFKLWLCANDPPKVRHADTAIWRRIWRLPFEHVVPVDRRDPTLKKRLCTMPDCQRAILAWAVEGALRWREEGLAVPDCIVRATADYRQSQNPLADFLAECCERGPDLAVPAGALYKAYEKWCACNSNEPVRIQGFAKALEAEGYERLHTKTGKIWHGVGMKEGDG
jgi:putative DNA primase/helicase